MVPRLCFTETSTLVPPNYAKEVFTLIDPDTPTCLLDGQPHYASNSLPSLPSHFIWAMRDAIRREGKMERELWESRKETETRKGKRAEEREVVRTLEPDAEKWFERKHLIFLSLVMTILTRGLAFISKKKRKSRNGLPEDPTLLEFNDLILYEVAEQRLPLSSEPRGICFLCFSQQHIPHHYQGLGIKSRGCGRTVWTLCLANVFLNHCRFSFAILLFVHLS